MRINKIHYHVKTNLGNSAAEDFTIVAEPEEGDSIQQCFEQLRKTCLTAKLPSDTDIYHKIYKGREALKLLLLNVKEAEEQWNNIRAFLIAQGVNPDAPSFPVFKALPQAIDGEIVEGNEI